MNKKLKITLSSGNTIDIELPANGGGYIYSDLVRGNDFAEAVYNAAIDGLESLILAHAVAGLDVESESYREGIETAVESINNNY